MVTGDHPATAAAIASKVGLRLADSPVLSGRDLPADEATLAALVDRDGAVVARVSPEDKLRIARALRARNHVVAMTGDGVNDGPALHEADIGIAGGEGVGILFKKGKLVRRVPMAELMDTLIEEVELMAKEREAEGANGAPASERNGGARHETAAPAAPPASVPSSRELPVLPNRR